MTTASPRPVLPRAVVVSTRWYIALMAAGIVTSALPLPWSLIGLGTSVASLIALGIAMVAVRRVATGGLWVLMVVGALLAGSMALNYAAATLVYDALHEYELCTRDAITLAAQRECEAAYQEASDARIAELDQWLQNHLPGGSG